MNEGPNAAGRPGSDPDPAPRTPRHGSPFDRIAPALRSRQFRRYWLGLLVSVPGYRFVEFGLFWLAHDLTGSALYLGYVGGATAIPAITLNLVGGLAADRLDQRKLVMFAETGAGTTVLVLALLTLTDVVAPWHVLVAAAIIGGTNALNQPARLALYPRYVHPEAVASAVALNSVVWGASRIAAPALAGVVIAVSDTSIVLFAGAAGKLAMAFVMTTLDPVPTLLGDRRPQPWAELREALAFIRNRPVVLRLMATTLLAGLLGNSHLALMPVFAVDILDVGPEGQGWLLSTAGLAAVVALLWLSTRPSNRGLGVVLIISAMIWGVSLTSFALTSLYIGSFLLAIATVSLVGVSAALYLNGAMATIVNEVPAHLRGRVMGIYAVSFNLLPLGALLAGGLAEGVGVPWAVAIGGIGVTLIAASVAATTPAIRHLGSEQKDTNR